MSSHINIMIGGEAGQGVQSAGFILAKTLSRAGYHVFADQDYESRVRGGHNFYRVRAADSEVSAISESLDILVALNEESIDLHLDELTSDGAAIVNTEDVEGRSSKTSYAVPFDQLTDDRIMVNTVALGAAFGLIDFEIAILEKVLEDQYGTGKSGKANIEAARAGYYYIRDNKRNLSLHPVKPINREKKMLLNGNEAIALGAIASGCRYVSSYPMTPSTSIMEYIAARADEHGIVVMQAEDEVAAINNIVGAGYAGVRSMTTTSGSGFCLMVEGLGLAGITETPVVIIDAQRPGPAVGLPTRTEQGDLQFALTAHHGEFPRIVLAPANIEDCFWLTVEAFNLADIYQTPVIILTDQYLASSYATVDTFDLSKVFIDRGEQYSGNPAEYRRHAITESGISPRAFPGMSEALVVTDSDEHDEYGHLTEDADIRSEIVLKRLRKMDGLDRNILKPWKYGNENPETLLVSWGSSYGAVRETVDILNGKGMDAGMINLNHLSPFPAEAVTNAMNNASRSIVVEGNATGQLANLIRTETGVNVDTKILKFDGRPITPGFIIEKLGKEVR
ncbi:MAG: 2-oxoacid:acceptor oxidoreductase subunit alpha [Dehalococcoidales bacterium]|nr:MAG: 2-oxoacid:acceptor oxidoreductase subunit alpha [Dehalococcoidales bacterium]